MTWLDVRYALVMATLVAVGYWLIQGLWLKIGNPIEGTMATVSVFIATLVVRSIQRGFYQKRQMPGPGDGR